MAKDLFLSTQLNIWEYYLMNISWNEQIYQIKPKLNRAIGILDKLRSHANLNTIRKLHIIHSFNLIFNIRYNYRARKIKKSRKQCTNSKIALSEKLILKNFTIL